MVELIGSKGKQYEGIAHVLDRSVQAAACGKLLRKNSLPVAGSETACRDCARITGVLWEGWGGRYTTSSKYGRVTFHEFDRLENKDGYWKPSGLPLHY